MRFRRFLLPSAIVAVACLALVAAPHVQAAYGLETAAGSHIPKTTDIAKIIANILRAALGFVGTLFLLLMVYAGFLWMTARGDSKKVDQAKQLITGAIIGVVIIASAYAITSFVIGAATGTGATNTGSQQTTGSGGAIGSTCTANSQCASGNCSGLEGSCTTHDAENDIILCFTDGDCPGGGTCEGESTNGTCAE